MMQALLSIVLLLLVSSAAGAAPSSLRKQAAVVKPDAKPVAKPGKDAKMVDMPVMMGEPVMVVVVDDGEAAAPQTPEVGSDRACVKEAFKLGMNRTLQVQADKCEDQGHYSQHALEALQAGNQTVAENLVRESFQKCAKISTNCSNQMATQVVRKLRFSGLAVSKVCAQKMNEMQSDEKKVEAAAKCEDDEKINRKLVDALNSHDMEGAAGVAALGLSKCHGIEHPCDTQIAPVIVSGIIQMAMREQLQQAMMPLFASAMEHAEEMKEAVAPPLQLAASTKKVTSSKTKKAASHRLSLLSVAQKLRFVKADPEHAGVGVEEETKAVACSECAKYVPHLDNKDKTDQAADVEGHDKHCICHAKEVEHGAHGWTWTCRPLTRPDVAEWEQC